MSSYGFEQDQAAPRAITSPDPAQAPPNPARDNAKLPRLGCSHFQSWLEHVSGKMDALSSIQASGCMLVLSQIVLHRQRTGSQSGRLSWRSALRTAWQLLMFGALHGRRPSSPDSWLPMLRCTCDTLWAADTMAGLSGNIEIEDEVGGMKISGGQSGQDLAWTFSPKLALWNMCICTLISSWIPANLPCIKPSCAGELPR